MIVALLLRLLRVEAMRKMDRVRKNLRKCDEVNGDVVADEADSVVVGDVSVNSYLRYECVRERARGN